MVQLKNKRELLYSNLEFALRPVPPERPDNVLAPSGSLSDDNYNDEFQVDDCSDPKMFTNVESNYLFLDVAIPNDSAHLLDSRLHEKNLLTPEISFSLL